MDYIAFLVRFAQAVSTAFDKAYNATMGFINVGLNTSSGVNGVISPVSARVDGFLHTVTDPSTLFNDPFDTLDTANNWNAGGTVPPTVGSGSLTFAAGTAANASSTLTSQPSFAPPTSSYLHQLSIVQIEATILTGNQRFWGLAQISTPTVAIPVLNGCIFEIDSATGSLFASVYSNSVRTQTTTLTRPIDGGFHRYAIYYRSSRAIYEIDNVVVMTFPYPNPQVGTLFVVSGSINGTTTLGTAVTMNVSVLGLGDDAKNNIKISDGLHPWRQATIKPSSTAALVTDTALVVAQLPLTKGTQGTNGLMVQEFKDSGRVNLVYSASAFASGATGVETQITLSCAADTGTRTAATSFVITSGKTFRITAIIVGSVGNATATNQTTTFHLRVNSGGAVTITSNIVYQARSASYASNSLPDRVVLPIPDGLEFYGNGTIQFGITAIATFVTNAPTWDVVIMGFEY